MKPPLRTFLLGLGLLSILNPQLSKTYAQGTAFTYQGVLSEAGAPASGIYDLRFAIYDAVTNGSAVGGARTNAATTITNSLFTVAVDFGAVFDGSARWLEIGVRPNGSAADFNTLSPRQPLTPTPYAIRAANFSGPVSASQLTGTISSNNIGVGSITTVMLAAGAVGSNQLASGAVTTAALANGAVTAVKVTTVSNWHALTIPNPAPADGDYFGRSVAAVGTDRLLIGAYRDDMGEVDAGAAFLLSANGKLLTTFTNTSPAASNWFGFSVAALGSGRVLIGSPYDDSGVIDVGVAFLFSTNGSLLATFTNPTPGLGDCFGWRVAAVGTDRVLIGTPYDDTGATDAGVAYLFSTNGVLLTTFTNPTPSATDLFGNSVAAVGNDRVLIGAYGDNTGADNAGAAYLFSTNGTLVTTFTKPTPAWADGFGYSVASVGADRVLIGVPYDDRSATDAGAAYLFNTNGTLLTTFANPTPVANDFFGLPVAAVGTDRVMIGALYDDTGATDAGTVYLFSTNGALLATFSKPAPTVGANFGFSVAAVGSDRVLIGAYGDDTGATNSGAAYLFGLESYTPGLVADGVNARSITTASLEDEAVTAAKIGGVLFASQIPELHASKITSGLFSTTRIPNLDASKIVSGTLADARLSTNVARLDGTNVFTGTNRFVGVTLATNANNKFAGSFTGDGSGLINLTYATLPNSVQHYGAVGDGVTDDTVAFQNAISNGPVWVPYGNYLVSNLVVTNSLVGATHKPRLIFMVGATNYLLDVWTNAGVRIASLELDGTGNSSFAGTSTVGTRHGINAFGYGNGNELRDLWIHGFNGYGIRVGGNGEARTSNALSTAHVTVQNSWCGLRCEAQFAEYANFSDLQIFGCRYGIWTFAGNQNFVACTSHDNYYGVYLANGANNGHGNLVGCTINHNTYAVFADAVSTGFTIVGNCMFQGILHLASSGNIIVEGNTLDLGEYRFESGFKNWVRNNTIGQSYANTVTHNYGGNVDQTLMYHNYRRDGTLVGDAGFIVPAGSVGIGTSSFTSNRLEVAGMVGATAFNTTSDRAAKQDFTAVDAQAVLARVDALPITQWRFKEFPGALHLGPVAQDFRAAFGLGLDDKSIATVDADGVALAAIQGLNQKLTAKEAELAAQREQIGSLQERLKSLEQLVFKLTQTK